MLDEKVMKEVEELAANVAKELKKINAKPEMSPTDLKAAMDALCVLEKIEKIQNGGMDDEGYSTRGARNSYSHRRMRNPMTGRYMSYDRGYSGHSVHDRMIAALEDLMDQAKTDYDRETIENGIRMIRQYEN